MARPLMTFRNKGVDVAAWPTSNGGVSFTIRKTYKDKQTSEYKESKSFFSGDLQILMDLVKQAVDWAHNEFQEPVSPVDTRPVHPKVAAVVAAVVNDEDDIPF